MSILVTIVLHSCKKKSTLLEDYKNEISVLQTDVEIKSYWNQLYLNDQESLKIDSDSVKKFDSISITQMMKTALMFEIHGDKAYKFTNHVPSLNLSHNYFGTSSLAFWPIVKLCIKERIDLLQYPAYQLECITGTLFDYSIYFQKEKHQNLLNKLDKIESNTVSKDLFETLNYQAELNKLKEVTVIGKWRRQQFEDSLDDGFFEIIEMSDGKIYYSRGERLQKLELIKSEADDKFYRIVNEPFGWYYSLSKNGNLKLIDDKDSILISYSKF